jgi:ribonuclease PH
VSGTVVADLDYQADSKADVDMNVVKLDDELVEIQGTGERTTFDRSRLTEMLDAADKAITAIFAAQRRVLGL